jgi:hypothetical protein
MMKTLFRFLCFALLGALVAACAGAPATPTAAPPAAAGNAEGSEVDVSMIAKTGRPQLIDSFATW